MFRKKICSALLLICLLLNMFTGMSVFAVDEGRQVSIRVEGINSTITKTDGNYRTQKTTVYGAVYELLKNKDIPIVVSDSGYGKYISSINGEEEATFGGYDGWMFIVNNETPDRSIDSYEINDGDNIVVYYGEFPSGSGESLHGTYIPTVELSKDTVEAGAEFTVTVTSTYYDWDKDQEVNVKIKDVEVGLCDKTYYTDEHGEAIVTAPADLGNYSLSISLDRADSYPLIVRTTRDITVVETVDETDDTKAPVIVVEGLVNGLVVAEKEADFKVTVTGNADENIVPVVKLNGNVITGTNGDYKAELIVGQNIISIEAMDAAGNKSDITYKLIYRTVADIPAKEHLAKSLDYIYENTPNPIFGIGGGEWSILSLARGEYEVSEGYYETYYNNVVNVVKRLMEDPNHPGRLDKNKGTEHSRLILALTSIGRDITDVGGYDIRTALADYDYVIKQGINGPAFALMAFDSCNYEIPAIEGSGTQSTRDMFIDYILNKEIGKDTEDAGGWALSGTNPDPNVTSMVIQGLAPYYENREDVKAAIDRAVTKLSDAQKESGDYPSPTGENGENIAQVVMALTELGIDPHRDARFIKNGRSAIDALLTYAAPEGGFIHVGLGGDTGGGAEAGVVDGMATDQGTCALVAYDRLIEGKNPFYDMTDVEPETATPVDSGEPGKNKTCPNFGSILSLLFRVMLGFVAK